MCFAKYRDTYSSIVYKHPIHLWWKSQKCPTIFIQWVFLLHFVIVSVPKTAPDNQFMPTLLLLIVDQYNVRCCPGPATMCSMWRQCGIYIIYIITVQLITLHCSRIDWGKSNRFYSSLTKKQEKKSTSICQLTINFYHNFLINSRNIINSYGSIININQ